MLVMFIVVDADIVDGAVDVSDVVDDDINNPKFLMLMLIKMKL